MTSHVVEPYEVSEDAVVPSFAAHSTRDNCRVYGQVSGQTYDALTSGSYGNLTTPPRGARNECIASNLVRFQFKRLRGLVVLQAVKERIARRAQMLHDVRQFVKQREPEMVDAVHPKR